jgi:hypothetical protein
MQKKNIADKNKQLMTSRATKMTIFESCTYRLNRLPLNNINKHKEFNAVITIPENSGCKK